jgi:hypothetical protein
MSARAKNQVIDEPEPLPGWVQVLSVVLFSLTAALASAITVLLVPLRIGTSVLPLSVLMALVTTIGVPVLSRRVVDHVLASVLPLIAWIATLVGLSTQRPEGDVLLPGTSPLEYVTYAVMIVGVIAGLVTVFRSEGARRYDALPLPDRIATGRRR